MPCEQPMDFVLEIKADLRFQAAVDEFFSTVLKACYNDAALASAMQLVISEAFTNVSRHAYPQDQGGPLRIELRCEPEQLEFRLIDHGSPFDPEQVPEPDAESLQVGGYGVHIIKSMVDAFAYSSDKGRNVLLLQKKI